jgi:hypothetical protein
MTASSLAVDARRLPMSAASSLAVDAQRLPMSAASSLAGDARALLAETALRRGVPVQITAGGRSMRPLIWPGDRLTIDPIDLAALRLDDIAVVLRDDGRLVAHRVVQLRPLILRGDGMPGPDLPVGPGQLLGRVACLERAGLALPLDGRLGRALGRLSRALSPAWLRLQAIADRAHAIGRQYRQPPGAPASRR